MTLTAIHVPDTVHDLPLSPGASELITAANERIELFHKNSHKSITNFVNCDFGFADRTLTWIRENHLATGPRFCELGSGFGVATMLAALSGMQALGIEIEPVLVDQATELAANQRIDARFYCGSFVPRQVAGLTELACEVEHVDTDEGDVFEEIGIEMDEFDLYFAFPWPGEHEFFESIFESGAADGSLLLTFRGRDGMKLARKS